LFGQQIKLGGRAAVVAHIAEMAVEIGTAGLVDEQQERLAGDAALAAAQHAHAGDVGIHHGEVLIDDEIADRGIFEQISVAIADFLQVVLG